MRELALVGLMLAVLFWLRRHPEDSPSFQLRAWPRLIRSWSKPISSITLALTIIVVLVASISIVVSLTIQVTGGPLTDPDSHPIVLTARSSWLLGLIMVAIVPIWEEIIFRDILQKNLTKRWPAMAAISVSSLIFGLFHLANSGTYVGAIVPPTFAGAGFGVAYYYRGLGAAIIAHSGYNILIYFLAFGL